MATFNSALWGTILPGALGTEVANGSLDSTQVIDDLLWTLHCSSRADLTFWSEADLIQWMDECLKRLSRVACVFVGRQAATLTVPSQATYALPDGHVATLHVSYNTTPLKPAGTLELEARDPSYQTTTGTPDHWYEDLLGSGVVGLCPVPDGQQFYPIIYEGWPAALDAGKQQTLVAAPAPLKGYMAMYVLAEAYGREGEMEAPEIAQHCRERLNFYETLLQFYYGRGN